MYFIIFYVQNVSGILSHKTDEQAEDDTNQVEQSMAGLERGTMRNTPNAAKKVRDTFMYYFNNEGKVAWQNNVCYS